MTPAISVSVTVEDEEYSAAITPGVDDHHDVVTVYKNDEWAGEGHWVDDGNGGATIADCGALLGDEVYEALDEALADEIVEHEES